MLRNIWILKRGSHPPDVRFILAIARVIRNNNINTPAVGIDNPPPQSTRCRMEATELEQLNEYIKGKRLEVVDEVRWRCRSLGRTNSLSFTGRHRTPSKVSPSA